MSTSPPATLLFPSKITGTTYQLHVTTRAPVDGPPRSLVLVTDGDDQFSTALAAYEKLRAEKRVRPLLLVGVGYGASYAKPANKRMRDYTPTAMAGEPGTGGADLFRQALRDEVIPFLEKQFPLLRDERGIAGHSLGSLFGLHAFFQREHLFTCCLASSPSIWFDDRSLLKLETEFARHHRTLPGRLFLSVGEEDSPSMRGDLALLEDALAARPYEKLALMKKHFTDRDHYNVLPDAFGEGLAALYPV